MGVPLTDAGIHMKCNCLWPQNRMAARNLMKEKIPTAFKR